MNQHRVRIVQLVMMLALLSNALPTHTRAAVLETTPSAALAQAVATMRQQSTPLPAQTVTTQPGAPVGPPANVTTPAQPTVPATVQSSVPSDATVRAKDAGLIHPQAPRTVIATQQHVVYLPVVGRSGEITTMRITPAGGELHSADGAIVLVFPANAVTEEVWVTLCQDAAPTTVAASRILGGAFDLSARTADGRAVSHFARALTLKVRYADSAASKRGVFFFDTIRQAWQALSSSDDNAGTLIATTDHFTLFAALRVTSGVVLQKTNGLADGTFEVEADAIGAKLQVHNIAAGKIFTVEQNPTGVFLFDAGNLGDRIEFHFADDAGTPLPFEGYALAGDYKAILGEGVQPLFVGQNASSWDLLQLFRSTYANLKDKEHLQGPDTRLVYDWDGYQTQGFLDQYGSTGLVLIYNAARCALYHVKGDVLGVYRDNGGPGGVAGPPISDELTVPEHYVNTGMPVGYFKKGIIARPISGGNFDVQDYYQQIGNIRFIFTSPSPTSQFTGTVHLTARPAPGNLASTVKLDISGTGPVGAFTEVATNEYTAPLQDSLSNDQPINLTLKAKSSDGQVYTVSVSTNAKPGVSSPLLEPLPPDPTVDSCDPNTVYRPPADMTPPKIGEPAVVQNGEGGVLISVEVTDDRAVAQVTITIDGKLYTATKSNKNGRYEVVQSLAIGKHTFEINAKDTAGNPASPKTGDFTIERSDFYGILYSKGYSKDPVSTAIGNLVYDYTDSKIVVPGPDIELKRFYNGQSRAVGLFGRGWTTPFDVRVTVMDNALVHGAIVRYADGRTAIFPANSGGGFDRAPTTFDTLATSGSGYQLTMVDQTRYVFDNHGWLTRIEDSSGNALVLTYTGDQLAQITSTSGRTVAVSSDAKGRVLHLVGPDNIDLTYTYDDDGRLISVTDSVTGTVTYHYDLNNGMTRIETPRHNDFLAAQTFDTQGRVIFQRVGNTFTNAFGYDDVQRTTTITDTYGHTTVHRYDEKGRLVAVVDSLGQAETYTYNDDDQRTSVTDRRGNKTLYEYDPTTGDKTKQTDPLGGITRWTYDPQHYVKSETDPLGRVTTYEYDAQGRRTAIINPLNQRTEMRYNAQGQMIEQISPGKASTTFVYDTQGNLVEQHDALGGITRYQFDAQGHRTKTVDANGNATTFTYDANGNLLAQTDALSNTTSYVYDSNNNRVSETNALGATTRYTYNNLGKLETTTYPDGGVQTIVYDDMGNRVDEKDQLGHTRTWTLDANYRVIAEIDALGATTSYAYDANGNRIAVTDANGHTTRYEFDVLNRVTKMIDPLNGETSYTYDGAGNRISETNPRGATTQYVYDPLNRVTSETNAIGATTTYTYDVDGNKISTTDALGGVTINEYDALNRVMRSTDALGGIMRTSYDATGNKVEMSDALGHVSRVAYDALNRQIAETDALGNITRLQYDALGNQIASEDALGKITRSAYDVMSRRVAVVNALGGKTVTEYDLAGRKISETDPLGHTTRFVYDVVGRQIATQDALGFVERVAYDAVGNQVSTTDKNGHLMRRDYDALNRLVAQTDGRNAVTRFVYDAASNQIARIDASNKTTTYGYDPLDRKVSETNQLAHTTRTDYDLLGRAIRTTFADGALMTRLYDALGRVVAERDAEGFTRSYSYDALGNQTTSTDALGVVTTTSYDALRRPVRVADGLGTLKETTYDKLGNVIAETDGLGNATHKSYDALHRLMSVADAAGNPSSATYDAAGNVVVKTDANAHTTRMRYDARNQLVAVINGAGNTTRYTYDGVGQRTEEINPLGLVTRSEYDQAGQLVTVTLNYRADAVADQQTNVATRFAYDPVGNRTSIIDPNGHTTTFTPDAAGQLAAETDALGNTTRYEYDQVGRQIKRIDPTGTTVVSTYNRNGLLVGVAYPDGSAVTRAYDGNRNVTSMLDSTGTTTLAYTSRNQLASEDTPRGRTEAAYDVAGNRISLRYADGKLVRYAYDNAHRLRSVINPDGATTTYERDGVGQIVRQTNGNGTATMQQYDAANRLNMVETRRDNGNGALIVQVAYDYDEAGQRIKADRSYAPSTLPTTTERYTHDPLARLARMERSDGVTISYTYDAAGNRTGWQGNDDPRTASERDNLDMVYQYDAADQMVQAQDRGANNQTDYLYDANGSRIEQRGAQEDITYRYDAEHHLVSVKQARGGAAQEIAAMAYDGSGRRVAKSEAINGSALETTAYLYDGLDPIATYATWNSDYVNLYRADGGRILQQEQLGNTKGSGWLTQDALGSTVAVADANGTYARTTSYDPYGTMTGSAGSGDQTDFTFIGQEGDEATGLYHFHARDYDPATATWLTRDPYRGSQSDPQSMHRYGYVKGNPVDAWDVYGYVALGGTYGKDCSRTPIVAYGGNFLTSIINFATGTNIQAKLNEMQAKCSVDTNIGDLKDIVQKLKTRKLFKRSLLPDGLKGLPLVKDQFDPYFDFFGDIHIDSALDALKSTELEQGELKIPICAEIKGGFEAGITLRAQVRVFAVDVYGFAGFEAKGCINIRVSTKSIGYDFEGEGTLYGGIGLRAYAVVDIGVTGVRTGLRFETKLSGKWQLGKEKPDFNVRFEGAPFVGYKPFAWWKPGEKEWEDKDLVTFSAEMPIEFQKSP